MKNFKLSRRHLLQGTAALGGAMGLGGAGSGSLIGEANAQTADVPAVLLVFLEGGYNALFSSADSFRGTGTFGVTGTNIMQIGSTPLFIDKATYGTNLPTAALSKIACVGINHGISSHDPARNANFNNGSRSYPLMLAAAMGGNAAIRCAVVGSKVPYGPAPAEGGVSLQVITDMKSTINTLSGGTTDPTVPNRAIAASALTADQNMGGPQFAANPNSLAMLKSGYAAGITAMQQNQTGFNYSTLASAYGVSATDTAIGTNFTKQMLAAELMITAGARVVIAINGGWDTHGDTTGNTVRNKMNTSILPGLKTFVSRMLAATGRNVTVAIYGDFARSLPGSDHARGISGTIIGKRVKPGTTGKMSVPTASSGPSLASGSPAVPGFYSLLATLSGVSSNPFGTNPHGLLVGP